MASTRRVQFKGSTKGAPAGFAYIKDQCEGCGRVVYGLMPLDTPLDPPRCSECKAKG